MNRRLRIGKHRKIPQTAVYLELWVKALLAKKAFEQGYSLSSYIRKLAREDLGIALNAVEPKNIVITELEDGTLLYGVNND